jgi:hypothetical protein
MPRAGRFTPGKDPVPIEYEVGWDPRQVWMGAENLVPTGNRSPDRPAYSQTYIDYANTAYQGEDHWKKIYRGLIDGRDNYFLQIM